jgi:hypothetical protein
MGMARSGLARHRQAVLGTGDKSDAYPRKAAFSLILRGWLMKKVTISKI